MKLLLDRTPVTDEDHELPIEIMMARAALLPQEPKFEAYVTALTVHNPFAINAS